MTAPPEVQAGAAAGMLGNAVAQALAGVLAQMLPAAITQAVAAAQPGQPLCAVCLPERLKWEAAHQAEISAAFQEAFEAAGVTADDPRAGSVDPTSHLPEHLRPGHPGVPHPNPAVTTVQGTDVCAMHVPGAPAGRPPLLIAAGPLSAQMLSRAG